jgi:two-component system, OmpR family, response regulator
MTEKLPLLIIEDEPSVQVFLRTALERDGFRTVMAANGTEGLKMLQEQSFSGVISDMRTPGGVNGGDVHEWLAANRPELAGRMLFITGDIVNEETTQILDRTRVPCIEKPFRVQELLAIVKQVMGN